jgi:hypothetical protein
MTKRNESGSDENDNDERAESSPSSSHLNKMQVHHIIEFESN